MQAVAMPYPRVHRELSGAVRWDRALLALTLLAGVVSAILILNYSKFPDPVWRFDIFVYLLRAHDLAGSALLIFIAVAAYLPRTRSAAVGLVETVARHVWLVAGALFIGLCIAMFAVVQNHPLAGDEALVLFQSKAFAAGRLTGQFPRDLFFYLIPGHYQEKWLVASATTGAVASVYWPGFALLLVPFNLIGAPWACNPLLASLSLVLMARLATRLTGSTEAGGWAIFFALGSPGFTAMALSYFSMTAHLLLNVLFAWLLLERGVRRLTLAGVVGSLALVQSNPVPHILFALPWIAWLARRPDGRRNLLALAAGYAPLTLLLGLGCGVALNPGTPVEAIEAVLDEIELVLVLAVNPGWGGQRFIPSTFDRLARAKEIVGRSGRRVLVGVDGGITRQNVAEVARAGADLIVTGSAVFDGKAAAVNARFMLDAVRAH